MTYLVFLDVDGVFTSQRVQTAQGFNYMDIWNKFDPIAVDFMNRIHHKHEVEFVLMTTWKRDVNPDLESMGMHWVTAAFRNAGFQGNFATVPKTDPNDRSNFMSRGKEVKAYLDEFGFSCQDFILFDDNDDGFEQALGKRRLIKTSTDNGLTLKNMNDALAMIGNWNYK
jgi:HAD domain in Swiss Army Knife RNA repair proteins